MAEETTKSTIESALEVVGQEDTVQLNVQGIDAQSEPLQQWADETGDALAEITNYGRLRSGGLTLGMEEAQIELRVETDLTDERPQRGLGTFGRVVGTIVDGVTWVAHELQLAGANTLSGLHTALQVVLRIEDIHGTEPDGQNATVRGADIVAVNRSATSIGRVVGTHSEVINDDGGHIVEAVGLEVDVNQIGNGTVETSYGIKVEDLPADGEEHYALHTGQGTIHLGDVLELSEQNSDPAYPDPESGILRLFPRTDGKLYARNHLGDEFDLTSVAGEDGTDENAIHTDEAGEIAAVVEKASPAATDLLLIEDSEDNNSKKRVQINYLPGIGTDDSAIHDNVANEIKPLTYKSPLDGDEVLLVEEFSTGAKKNTQVSDIGLRTRDDMLDSGDIGPGSDTDAFHGNGDGEYAALGGPSTANFLSLNDSYETAVESTALDFAKLTVPLDEFIKDRWPYLGLLKTTVRARISGTVGYAEPVSLKHDATHGMVASRIASVGSQEVSGVSLLPWGNYTSIATAGSDVYIKYTGIAPQVGDYLITSATGGYAQRQTHLSPEIFAVCTQAGDGAVCKATLLLGRKRVQIVSANNIVTLTATSDFNATGGWSGTIAASPNVSPVRINTTAGYIDSISAVSTDIGKIVIYNSTRGNSALLTHVTESSGNYYLHFLSSVPLATWQIGDTLTVNDPTYSPVLCRTIDVSNSNEIPKMAVDLGTYIVWRDSAVAGKDATLHPWVTWDNNKAKFTTEPVAGQFIRSFPSIPLVDGKFGCTNSAGGIGTGFLYVRISYATIAVP